jgi:hypothetical protein
MPIHNTDQPLFSITKSYEPTDDFSKLIDEMVAEANERIKEYSQIEKYPEMTVNEEKHQFCLTVYQYIPEEVQDYNE